MEKNKKLTNIIIILISAIIVVLLLYILFYNKKELVFKINDSSIKIKINENKKINYELSNLDIVINWSSNNDIVSINENGEIIGHDYGKAIITGTVVDGDKTISNTCNVEVYTGEIGINVESINVVEGYLLMKTNSEYELPFSISPLNSYITSIEYTSSNPNAVFISGDKVISKGEGKATLTMTVNGNISKDIMVVVSNKTKENGIIKEIDGVTLTKDITMEMGDSKTLEYETNPKNGYIETIEWFSSDPSIVSVIDGDINAINVGTATITVRINNKVTADTLVIVKASKAELKIDYNPKTTIRIGEKTNIKAHINPTNINEKIIYKSSNSNIVSVDNGTITGVSTGTAVITLSISNGKTKSYTINVLPKSGSFSGTLNLWGYKSLNSKNPVLADKAFFQRLASSGIGILQNNTYVITTSDGKFTYDIDGSLLSINNKKIRVRIYYPEGVDLSTTNTLTFMGGRGETNFDGMFKNIANDSSIVKSAGILALIAEGSGTSFDGDSGAYTTMFVKAITKQKAGVKNSILGFSDGAHKVMHASNKMVYNTIIVFSGYTDGVDSLTNAKNSEVFFIIGSSDGNYSQAQNAISHMKNSGYNNVTIISTGNDMATKFSNKFLVLNPGNLMKNGHLTENILLSGMIEYCND